MIEVTIHYPVCRLVNEPAYDRVRVEFVLPKRPFLFWANMHAGERIPLPRGFGVAYCDFMWGRVLMAPMPFNVLVGFLIWLHLWTKYIVGRWLGKHIPREGDGTTGSGQHQ